MRCAHAGYCAILFVLLLMVITSVPCETVSTEGENNNQSKAPKRRAASQTTVHGKALTSNPNTMAHNVLDNIKNEQLSSEKITPMRRDDKPVPVKVQPTSEVMPLSSPTPVPVSTPYLQHSLKDKQISGRMVNTDNDKGTLCGLVNNKEGDPLEGVVVTITGENFSDSTVTDKDGFYRFLNLEAGNYTLIYEKNVHQFKEKGATPDTQKENATGKFMQESEHNGAIFGFLNDNNYYDALEGVTVTIKGENFSDSIVTDKNGFYHFTGLSPGNYKIICKKENYEPLEHKVSLEAGEIHDMGTINIEQIDNGYIYGYVVDGKGWSVENVVVKLKGVTTLANEITYSDKSGYFDFVNLEKDTYLLITDKEGYKRHSRMINIDREKEKGVEIRLRKEK